MLRTITAGFVLASLGISLAAAQGQGNDKASWDFDRDTTGSVPSGFLEQVGIWKVTEYPKGKVLAQLERNSDPTFNLILIDTARAKDVDISVRLRPINGELDQGGGLVWRAKNAQNYYIARYNPLEDNFRVYKVEKDKRTLLRSAEVAPTKTKAWRSLRVTMAGNHIECFLDGKKLLDAHDATFPDEGTIGLWTKADARTEFDDLTFESR